MNDYKVKLEIFEGPLDLLLHLIKVHEMDITDIKVSVITEQYLAYLRLMEGLDLEIAGDFLVMASTLLNIKLRSLLPAEGEEEEDEEEVSDLMTAQALMEKLVEYRKFKEASTNLKTQAADQADVFFREVALPKLVQNTTADELGMDVEHLISAFQRVLPFIESDRWHFVSEEEYSVEEKIDWLEGQLELEGQMDIESVFKTCETKIELIVLLLAMLELCQFGRATIVQSSAYEPIYLRPKVSEEPSGESETEAEKSAAPPPPAGPVIVDIVKQPEIPMVLPRTDDSPASD